MNNDNRRYMLAIGAVLLVSGLGVTGYASLQEEIVTAATTVWDSNYRSMYIVGIIGMAIGAGLIAFAIPKSKDDEK